MSSSRSYGWLLGGASLAVGAVAAAVDAPAAAVVAGVCGLAAGALGATDARARAAEEAKRRQAEAREAELATAVADAEERAATLQELIDATEAEAQLTGPEAEALLDPVTGLYGEQFFRVTLVSRVAAARRHLRPVAVVLLELAAGVKEGHPTGADPALVAGHIRATLREADTACYLEAGRFGLVLEDTPENGAVWTVERVRRALAVDRKDLTLWAGVACYPAHAFDADELLSRATAAIEAAKEWRQDRIEVATTSDV